MKMPGEQISTLKRATQGVRLINLKDDQMVATVTIVAKEEETESENVNEDNTNVSEVTESTTEAVVIEETSDVNE